MRVAFATYPTAFQRPGGGENVLLALADALRRRDVDVTLFDPWNQSLSDVDVLHHFSSHGSALFAELRRHVPCLAVTPFIWPELPRLVALERKARRRLSRLAGRRSAGPFAPANIVFPTSTREADLLIRNYGVRGDQVVVVPHGADERFEAAPTGAFRRAHHLSDYVLYPGRIDPNKNQLRLVRALATSDLDLVILGAPGAGHEDYDAACRAAAGPRTHFVPPLPRDCELLVDAVAGASCVVIASEYELCSVAALEAGRAGVPLASTTGGGMIDHLSPYAIFFDPRSEAEMREAVAAAIRRGRIPGQREHFARTFSWDAVADRTVAAYEAALER